MSKEDKKIDISELPKLQEWVDNTDKSIADMTAKNEVLEAEKAKKDEEIITLKKEVSDIGDLVVINKDRWKETDEQKKVDYELGKWFARWRLGFHKFQPPGNLKQERSIASLLSKGFKPLTERVKIDNGEVLKDDMGTPLTGDAAGTDAQYLIPAFIYETEIIRTADMASEVIPLFARKKMTGRKHRYPVESTVATLTYVTNEVTDKTESNPTWTNVDLECETFATWIGITDELLEDTFVDIGSQIRVQVAESYVNTVEEQMLDGSGSPFTGALRESAAKKLVIASTSIKNVDWDDAADLIAKLTERKYRQGAVFIMHPTIWDIFANMKNADGDYYYRPDTVTPKAIKGYPVKLSDNMPSVSDDTSNKAFFLFGNPKWMLLGLRMGLEFRYFDQTMYAVQDDENFWRARTRIGCKIAVPANYAVLKTAAK